jgi:hypothetical protein
MLAKTAMCLPLNLSPIIFGLEIPGRHAKLGPIQGDNEVLYVGDVVVPRASQYGSLTVTSPALHDGVK